MILLLTFVLGGIAGALAHRLYLGRTGASTARNGGRPTPHDIAGEFAQGLSLDAAQRDLLKAIISTSREKYRALSRETRPQYNAIREQTNEEIRKILREDQKARFEEIVKEIEQRRRNRPGPPGPRDPGGLPSTPSPR